MYIERGPLFKFEYIILLKLQPFHTYYAFDWKNILPEKAVKIIISISPRSSAFRIHHRKYIDREGLGRSSAAATDRFREICSRGVCHYPRAYSGKDSFPKDCGQGMVYFSVSVNQRKRSYSKKVCHTYSKAENRQNLVLVGGIQSAESKCFSASCN